MTGPVVDRRRGERFEVISPVLGSLTVETPDASQNYSVELLELGVTGALVALGLRDTAPRGAEGWFATSLAGNPFSVRVDIRRVEERPDAQGRLRRLVAMQFADVIEGDVGGLRRFLGL